MESKDYILITFVFILVSQPSGENFSQDRHGTETDGSCPKDLTQQLLKDLTDTTGTSVAV